MPIWNGFVGLLEQFLLWCAQLTGSVGLGIILFTVFARLAILPLTLSSIRSSRKLQELQPQIKEIQRKYGKDQQKLQEETLRLYREYKINPLGGCLPLFLQLPIFFGVYQAVYHLMVEDQRQYLSQAAATLMADPAVRTLFETPFLGLINLGLATWGPGDTGFNGSIYLVLPILSIFFQFIQQIMATPRVQDPQQKAITQTMMFLPLVFGYIAFTFPSGAVLYWVASSVVGIIQQYFTTGWGSLANYLKFLPPDGKPVPTLTPATASAAASSSTTGEVEGETQRQDFWSVLRPLTELDSGAKLATETGQAQDGGGVEGTIKEERTVRTIPNPRRIRRRR
jgi:YidC/Oxa1 family membrane protein insertase